MRLLFIPTIFSLFISNLAMAENLLKESFVSFSQKIETEPIRRAVTQNNGRLKPLDSLARESLLLIHGKRQVWGLPPTQAYLGLMAFDQPDELEFIEIRDPELRVELGFLKTKRHFSIKEIEASPLQELTGPVIDKQEREPKNLNAREKAILETYGQYMVAKQITTGQHLFQALDFSPLMSETHTSDGANTVRDNLQALISSLRAQNNSDQRITSEKIVAFSHEQKVPEMFHHYLGKMDLEIFYNDWRLFFLASLMYLLLGLILLFSKANEKIPDSAIRIIFLAPLLLQTLALTMRVYITEFAPVTNMYGTMIWVSMGVNLFGFVLFSLYKNRFSSGIILLCSGVILYLAESIPLVLSPDMDPIVAVLRNNFWLSTHVTTITISYAAFTIAMVLGNVALIRQWTHKDNKKFFKDFAHYAYRMIQLGCFLLTMGIILGGIWADYSWGRFWGWDPKETWALIADLGFLAILHARIIGWVDDFKLLAFSTLAYLLVIMAWYGVNFILAAGLHSYGFSSGGALAVGIFVSLQLGLLSAGLVKRS